MIKLLEEYLVDMISGDKDLAKKKSLDVSVPLWKPKVLLNRSVALLLALGVFSVLTFGKFWVRVLSYKDI